MEESQHGTKSQNITIKGYIKISSTTFQKRNKPMEGFKVKCMGGLGGSKSWEEFEASEPLTPILRMEKTWT